MTINEMIQKLSEIQEPKARTKANYEVFKALLQNGEIYVVCNPQTKPEEFEKGDAVPFTAALEDNPYFYTRIFSDLSLAEKYADYIGAKSPEGKYYIVKFNEFQLCALAKDSFISGIDGFLLNEGDSWTTIRCDGIMKLFLVDISSRPDMYNQHYVNVVNTIHGIARHGVLYSAAIFKGDDGKKHALTLNDVLQKPASGSIHGKKICNLVLPEQHKRLLRLAEKKNDVTLLKLPMPVFYSFVVELWQTHEADEIAFAGDNGSICAPVNGLLEILKEMPYAGFAKPAY